MLMPNNFTLVSAMVMATVLTMVMAMAADIMAIVMTMATDIMATVMAMATDTGAIGITAIISTAT